MLYEFRCRATGSVVMTQKVGERMLAIIGKSPSRTGIIVPEQMPAAIRALEEAVELERAQPAVPDDDDEHDRERPRPVSLAQRAWPFIEMLKAALAAEREITWGV
ncbi:MAG: DUF1840 domain-containing protein [Burkholderiaceae bacterium]